MEMENMIEDAVLVEEVSEKKEEVAEAYDPMDLAMTNEGRPSIGLVKKMNDLFKHQVDSLKKTVEQMKDEEIPTKEKELDNAYQIAIANSTVLETLSISDIEKKDENLLAIIDMKDDVVATLDIDTQEIVNKVKNAYISLKSTENIINHYMKTMYDMDIMCIRKDNLIALTQLIPFMVEEIISGKSDAKYIHRCVNMSEEELTEDKIKAIAEATRNLLKNSMVFLRKDLSKLMPMGGVDDATKSALEIIPNMSKISVEMLPDDMKHNRYTLEAAFNIALLLLMDRSEYAFEKDTNIRLTPSVAYEAKLLQIVDALGVPSLEAFRNILIIEIADIIEATKDKVPLFKKVVDFMQDKINYIKETNVELYEKKIEAANKFSETVNKLHEEADRDLTDEQIDMIKSEIDESAKNIAEKMGIKIPEETKEAVVDTEIVEETKAE